MDAPHLGWLGIVRLGLVQTALGAIVVLTTSTMNRVMVVELALPAALPGVLVGWHYAIQLMRPRWGYGSDVGGRLTPWIILGMAILAVGGTVAAMATALMGQSLLPGICLAIVAFTLIGVGVGASGTSLLVLLAKRTAPERRAAAATITWTMMIFGFVVTAGTVGHYLDPFSAERLVLITCIVAALAFIVTVLAVWRIEGHSVNNAFVPADTRSPPKPTFRQALSEVWQETQARRFTIFVFVSMLAYSAQDLILEPFAGEVFGLTPGQSTKLSGVQHGGVLTGMIGVALIATLLKAGRAAALRVFTVTGCIASAAALLSLSAGGLVGPHWPLSASVFLLGLANGAFAIAAIGSMMALAGEGRASREGVRMGLWGAAQAIAFGVGGLTGAVAVDVLRRVLASPMEAYITVFALEAVLFLLAAGLILRVKSSAASPTRAEPVPATLMGANMLAGVPDR
jgi:BCD family chlorophyll transporter-like MFS transporter